MELKLRRGRNVKLNYHDLPPNGRNRVNIVFFGDLHAGHPTCLWDKAQAILDFCLERGYYVMLMGDLLECGITGSVGDSVYTQSLNPQGQMEAVIELLKPLAKAGLILGMHAGNHEHRIFKTTGINVAKNMAGWLEVPFLHSACWSLIRVGKQNYKIYSLHGATGSRFVHTKIKAATDISHFFHAEIIAHAHVHDLASASIERQYIDMKNKQVAYWKQYIVLSGHYLGYDLSYAQEKGFPPSKVGSPKVQLYSDKWDVHVSE